MAIKKYIPNLFTLLNLFSGLIALIYAFNSDFKMAFIWVCAGIFFDFWDGFLARILKAQSPVGLQLDSLADMVTSGVVPGVVVYKLLSISYGISRSMDLGNDLLLKYIPYIGFVITLASCYRLAKFNVDTRQTESFIGLPTPANALLILSIPLVLEQYYPSGFIFETLANPYVLIGISFLSAYLLNAEIPLFSLKVKSFQFGKIKLQVFFLLLCIVLIVFLKYLGVTLSILSYIILSVINNSLIKKEAKV